MRKLKRRVMADDASPIRPASSVMIRISILAVLISCIATMAAAADDLYSAQTVVTGQGEPNRTMGFAACLEDVLIKVSGAAKLAGDPRLFAYQSRAKDFVKAHRYHDQMSGTPIRDEQGTRDRPYDLIVEFDEKKIDDLLEILGMKPWRSHRPALVAFVEMEQGARRYIVMADGGLSAAAPRESLLAASAKRGLTVVLPDVAALAKSGIDGGELAKVPPSALAARAAEMGGEVALVGRLKWDDSDLKWVSQWQMERQDGTHRWQVRSRTFDEVFRRAIGAAAQILSGNGDPG
jgi:uncharacterized protein